MKLFFAFRDASYRREILQNLVHRIRQYGASKTTINETTSKAGAESNPRTQLSYTLIDRRIRRLLPLVAERKMDLVKQINANHESLLERLNTLESVIAKTTQNENRNENSNANLPPTDAEIGAERSRLIAENAQLCAQIESLVRNLTELEITMNGRNSVAPLDLLPKYGKQSSPAVAAAQPNSIPANKHEQQQTQKPQQQTKQSKIEKIPAESQPKDGKKNISENQQATKKAPKKAAKSSAPANSGDSEQSPQIDASRLDLRVGRIVEVQKHPDADSLYVEQIDCGEEKPRTVVSGLVRFVELDAMRNRLVVVLCNLKPAKMRGITSEAMVMCASTAEKVEILSPPDGAVPGDRVSFEKYPGTPDTLLNPKKKIWEQIAPDLATNDELQATYKGDPFVIVGKGAVKAQTLKNVIVK